MTTFCVSLVLLVLGFLFYSRVVEHVFGVEPDRPTPAVTKSDGVDYVPMATWRVFLVQFLNIAGTGPIFGAIMGILFGPAAYLWIVFGCIFAGAVHDYLTGMISIRSNGANITDIVGQEMGNRMRVLMLFVTLIMVVLVGAVFTRTPADLLAHLTEGWEWSTPLVWMIVIFLYYILATLLPINALIGHIYPLFGAALLIMAMGVGIGIFTRGGTMPEITDPLAGNHPAGIPVFPAICVTIACGAISGFHSSQTPMMARCIKNESLGRTVFYGAMIAEGIVALIWAAAGIKFASTLPGVAEGTKTTYQALADMGTPAVVVNTICSTWMGKVGAVLAVLGVVAAPITTGDTAFRSARLIAADFLKIPQRNIWQRLFTSAPFFLIAGLLMVIDFKTLWSYFGWTNQVLAAIGLWAFTVWLSRRGKFFWITLLPALFLTAVTSSHFMLTSLDLGLKYQTIVICGGVFGMLLGVLFLLIRPKGGV
ncbi:MAG: carbon starvation protein A [Bacteroidaceae bacterium]|nr:carbon starvation protein A [Bacteroidaceae bacterium]